MDRLYYKYFGNRSLEPDILAENIFLKCIVRNRVFCLAKKSCCFFSACLVYANKLNCRASVTGLCCCLCMLTPPVCDQSKAPYIFHLIPQMQIVEKLN